MKRSSKSLYPWLCTCLLLAGLVFSSSAAAQTYHVLLVGDSWAELMWYDVRCIAARDCLSACPLDALGLTPQGMPIDRARCDGHGEWLEYLAEMRQQFPFVVFRCVFHG